MTLLTETCDRAPVALSGINLFLGMTGQEEVQYKVFEKFGLNDTTIR